MKGKLTLITPPDFFENDNLSIFFIHPSDTDQEAISRWLSKTDIDNNINLYVYSGEDDIDWFFYAMARCEYKYIDIDGFNSITQSLGGYILGKSNVYYKTSDTDLSKIYSRINSNRVEQIETFLESTLSDQTRKQSPV
jgi:hypothetical protein